MSSDHSSPTLLDSRGRPLRDLRLSLIDLCNFRCVYCMPPEGKYDFFKNDELLSPAELLTLATAYISLGVQRIRLTGGEPLLRKEVLEIVRSLAVLPGLHDLSLTTNGSRLAELAAPLKDAGLKRVTVSLDAIEPEAFKRITGGRGVLEETLAGIRAAQAAGLGPVKLNAVIRKGLNDDQIVPLARWARTEGLNLRFIEFMDVGNRNHWEAEQVINSKFVHDQINAEMPMVALDANFFGEVAERYAYQDGIEVGFISSVSTPFCATCTRTRVSADGKIYNCLFSGRGMDLKPLLRGGATPEELVKTLKGFWEVRTNRYSEERAESRSSQSRRPIVEMFQVGG